MLKIYSIRLVYKASCHKVNPVFVAIIFNTIYNADDIDNDYMIGDCI